MSILNILENKDDVIKGKGVSDKLIKEAEKELDLTFSDDYKEYLSTVGLLMCNGHELTGIGKADRTNVVKVTLQMKALVPDIPKDWYVVENENMDGAAMWQDSKGYIFFNKKKEYSSFSEYLEDM